MKSYNVYKINFNNLAAWLIPKPLRKTKFSIVVKACIYPLVSVYNSFLNYRDAKIYQLTISPQVCYLEKLLNDRYDYTLRRIYIDDAIWHLPTFIYKSAENKPVFGYKAAEGRPNYLFTNGETGTALNDFVVHVPALIAFDQNEMKSLINIFKLFGTQYTIQLF